MGKALIRAIKALSQSVFALSSSNERVRGSNFPLLTRRQVQVKSVLYVSEDGFVHGIKFIWICFLPIPALLLYSFGQFNSIRHSEELREIEEIRVPREGE